MGQQDLKRYKESVKEYMTDAVTNLQKYLSLQNCFCTKQGYS